MNKETNTIDQVALFSQDITDSYLKEQVLRENEQKYRLLFETMYAGFAIYEPIYEGSEVVDLKFLEANPSLEKWTGLNPAEIIDKGLLECGTPLTKILHKHCIKAFSSQTPGHFELNAEHRYYEVFGFSPSEDRFATMIIEITSRKNTEKELAKAKITAESAAKAKSNFLATMSHEIRTPLNGIMGMASLLGQAQLEQEQHEYVDLIHLCGENLLSIINDILDYSKMETEEIELHEDNIPIRKLLDDVLGVIAIKTQEKRIDLFYQIDPHLPDWIVLDETRLRQILINFLNNAVKFSDQGEIQIQVQLLEETKEHLIVEFSIIDQGIGISKKDLAHLFDAFSQGDNSQTRKYGGTGLGLAINHQLIQKMQGKITVESTINEGSTFSFSLSCKRAESSANEKGFVLPVGIQGKKVTVIDSRPVHGEFLVDQINYIGCHAHALPLDLQSLLNLKTFQPDLIVLHLPNHGELLKWLPEFSEEAQRIKTPLILLSRLNETFNEFAASGLALIQRKPFRLQEFGAVACRALENTNEVVYKRGTLNPELSKSYPLKILVAEDNELNQTLILRILEKLGYQADLAENGIEVLNLMHRRKYDLLLLDIQMPEMDGLEVVEYFMTNWKKEDLPVISAVTANAMQGDREKYLKAGMNYYLSKPVDPLAIEQLIMEVGSKTINKGSHVI